MNKVWLRKAVVLMMVALMIFGVLGCSPQEAVKPSDTSGENTSQDTGNADQGSQVGFSWEQAKGSKITILLNQHTVAEAIKARVAEFEALTGITVQTAIIPESNYYDKLTVSLSSGSEPDVWMCGPLMPWELAGANYIEDLTPYIEDSTLTNDDYDVDDFFGGVLGTFRWDKVAGHATGEGPQWSVPMVFEEYVLGYNKRIFAEHNLTPPTTMDELLECAIALQEFDGPGTYGLAVRGSREWPTITTSYITNFMNYGGQEWAVENGKLVSKVNEPAGVAATQMYVDLITKGGSPTWSNYTWYECAADLGAGKAAMLFDADLVIYDQNVKDTAEAGNIAFTPIPMPEGKTDVNSNLWGWGLSMNAASKQKIASWLFIQYFTGKDFMLKAAVEDGAVNPARESIFNNADFQAVLEKTEGYLDTFNATIGGTSILSTPQPHFYETTTEWASTLQDIVNGKYATVQEGMDALKAKMDQIVSGVVIE
jgi:multiple sugar transport system substrate-binding protein